MKINAIKNIHNFDAESVQNAINKSKYFVERTTNKFLPIYTDYRKSGLQKFTIIRKVYGNHFAFGEDLKRLLPSDTPVTIRPDLQQIKIKGLHGPLIKRFLISKGF